MKNFFNEAIRKTGRELQVITLLLFPIVFYSVYAGNGKFHSSYISIIAHIKMQYIIHGLIIIFLLARCFYVEPKFDHFIFPRVRERLPLLKMRILTALAASAMYILLLNTVIVVVLFITNIPYQSIYVHSINDVVQLDPTFLNISSISIILLMNILLYLYAAQLALVMYFIYLATTDYRISVLVVFLINSIFMSISPLTRARVLFSFNNILFTTCDFRWNDWRLIIAYNMILLVILAFLLVKKIKNSDLIF